MWVTISSSMYIENFGSMDVLCSDKTGTVTEGRVTVHSVLDASGRWTSLRSGSNAFFTERWGTNVSQ